MFSPTLLTRLPATPPRLMRTLAIAAAVAQAGIAVTGSVVRVTGSGLGCPTWPSCFPDSLTPDPRYDVALLHQWVEFGNRMLTGVLTVVVAACLLAALGTRPRRRRLTLLALSMPAGVVAQAVIGGITVLAGLAWWTVSVHFLVSMVLVWLAVLLVRATGELDGPAGSVLPAAGRGLLALSTATLGALLVAGTLVTAAGPHAGDAKTPRLGLGVPQVAQLHGDLVVGYLGLLVGLGFLFRAVRAPAGLTRRYWVLIVAVLAQGALGATQYVLGVPEVLVSLHVLGASLVTAAAAAVWAASTARPTLASASTEGTPVHDTAPAHGTGPAHGTAPAHGTGPSTSNNAPSTPAELSSS
ncbi:MAG TPA: COX15/CtaA family protein [Pseudonocardia sp.]|uniref:COX15/CtaA family protein n=1 Tax=Pseudonocardia sp. TaxID=60912 RepID=UPI002EDACBA1